MKLVVASKTVALLLAVALAGPAQGAAVMADDDLGELSLDQLMGITITSASKKEERANEVPAAIYVITQEDIRRSGMTTIPEVLRMVPGMQVSQQQSHSWGVSARGFNGFFASKLLVLIDGRSVYTPLFSGVYWDVQDTLLEDVERIEVIRGPGATVWGANAVNGVINIITKKAEDTQGILSHAGAGNEERGFAGLRYGGKVGENLHYRVYGKYFDRDNSQTGTGAEANDDWEMARGGFRMEWTPTDKDVVTLQGDGYDGDVRTSVSVLPGPQPNPVTFVEDQQVHGWNMLGRWSHEFNEGMDASVQVYYDRTDRSNPLIDEIRHTWDVEAQHRFQLPFNQEVIWGGGYRFTTDRTQSSFAVGMVPSRRSDDTFSFFVQDEIRFFEDKLRLTAGTKVENNDYTGWEYQPSVRAAFVPTDKQMLWASVSRAVRVPNRAEDNALLNSAFAPLQFGGTNALGTDCTTLPFFTCPATLVSLNGSGTRTSKSERLYAFEMGWRGQFFERVTIDVTAFRNDYNFLASIDTAVTPIITGPTSITLPTVLASEGSQRTWGVETDMRADVTDWWRLILGYAYLGNHEDPADVSHRGVIRSQIDLPFNLELDAALFLVGNSTLLASGTQVSGTVPSYERLDLRLGWRPNELIEVSLVGQNLTDNRHPEKLGELGIFATEVQRAFYGKVTYRY